MSTLSAHPKQGAFVESLGLKHHPCLQASLDELLESAREAGRSADDINYKGTAVIMSMRFHFASTFAKLQEWPSEISRTLECSPSGAACAAAEQLVEEMKPHVGAVQAVPDVNVGAPQVGVAGELESILTAMHAGKHPAPASGVAATTCSVSTANGTSLSDMYLPLIISLCWIHCCTQSEQEVWSHASSIGLAEYKIPGLP